MLWMILQQGYLPHISPLLQITVKYVSLFTYREPLIQQNSQGILTKSFAMLLLGPCHAWTGYMYPKSQNSGHRSRALDRLYARANAIGTVPIAFARAYSLSSILERAHWPSAILPAARWRLARRARWLAGRARASSQSQIYA